MARINLTKMTSKVNLPLLSCNFGGGRGILYHFLDLSGFQTMFRGWGFYGCPGFSVTPSRCSVRRGFIGFPEGGCVVGSGRNKRSHASAVPLRRGVQRGLNSIVVCFEFNSCFYEMLMRANFNSSCRQLYSLKSPFNSNKYR